MGVRHALAEPPSAVAMRQWLGEHSAPVGSFLALAGVAALLSLTIPVPGSVAESGSPLPAQSIPLPGLGQDNDNDTYANADDLTVGDLQVTVRLQELRVQGSQPLPYVLLGTQDDQWRTGAGAELEWRHVVDPDSLGYKAGSPAWQESVLRTGTWWMSRPGDGQDIALAVTDHLPSTANTGAHWPQTLWANVRDDRAMVALELELRDASTRPHAVRVADHIEVRIASAEARIGEGPWMALPANLTLGDGANQLLLQVDVAVGMPEADAKAIARRWAPALRFDSEEAFYPVRGEVLEEFHGFARPRPGGLDLRTWDPAFNAGRDQYNLFLADFDGDDRTDRRDAQLLGDILAAGAQGAPTVYTHVHTASDGQVVVQYWFLYLYNFVLDDSGNEVTRLAHKGDREFVQLTFPSIEAARNGTPTAIAFSQHYEGLLVTPAGADALPLEAGRLVVHVARGSHANYPVPGDDRRLRSSLTPIFDRFDGAGRVLDPGNYTLEHLEGQPWHAGYKWGPVTRYTRDLGVASRPLLQHDFRYPFTDPLWWQVGIPDVAAEDLSGLYGEAP